MFDELLKNVMNLGIITEDDVKRLTAIELMLLIIERTNGLLIHVENVDAKLATLLENIRTTTIEELSEWKQNGTFDALINQHALKGVNDRIDETKTQLSKKVDDCIDETNAQLLAFKEQCTGRIDETNAQLTAIREHCTGGNGAQEHSHINKSVIDKLTEHDGKLCYDGEEIVQEIKDNSISREKMSYYQLLEKNNLYDRSKAMIGQTYNNSGELVNGRNNTNFIETEPCTTYYYTDQKENVWTCYWTRNKEFISGANTRASITTPENCYFVTVTIYNSYVDDFYFSKDKDNPTRVKYTDEELYISGEQIINSDRLLTTPLDDSVSTEKIQDNAVTSKKVDFIDKNYSINLFDKDDNVRNGYYHENGTWSNGGEYYSSTHIPVEPNTEYTFKATRGSSWVKTYWDENKVALGVKNWNSNFVTPENCYYVTVTMSESDIETAMLVKGSSVPSEYVPFVTYELSERVLPISKIKELIESMSSVGSNLSGLKWNVLGDSITQGYGYTPYHTFIAKNKGMALVRNYGIGGNRLATDGGTNGIPMCIRYAEMDDDADIITVMGGTNDYNQEVPLGVMSDRTVDTFYGSLHVLIRGLIEKYPGKVIALFTPLQRQGCKNNNGFSEDGLVKYVDAIIDVCAYYSIPCLDLFRKGGLQVDVPSIKEEYMTDGLHPTTKGHEEVLARIIGGFLESIC